MRKSILTGIAISLMMAGSLFSQDRHLDFGVKAGVNLYNVNNSNTSTNTDIKAGLYLGLLAHMHLSDMFAIQPELYYSLQGNRSGDNSLNLGYVNVPLLAQYMFANGFRIQAGPQLGVLLHANTDATGNGNNVADNYKTLEAGVSVGASYIHMPSGFGADIRYNHGLTDITKNSTMKHTNRGIQLGVFYMFNHS